MRAAILAFTETGAALAKRVANMFPDHSLYLSSRHEVPGFTPFESAFVLAGDIWPDFDSLVFICATGIAVRAIGPLAKDKTRDPAVIVCDEHGKFAISLLSGHAGGANLLAQSVASAIGAMPVVTTASDSMPSEPKNIALGIGCRRGATAADIERAASILLWDLSIPLSRVCEVATIDVKKDEAGLIEFARLRNLPIFFFSPDELKSATGDFPFSQRVQDAVGVGSVCDRAASLRCPGGKVLMEKRSLGNVSVSAYEKASRAKISVVGFGPGNPSGMTRQCLDALSSADVIVCYTGYLKHLRPLFPRKEFIHRGMRKERERARLAIEAAQNGLQVCVASSGDPGVYGMASLVLEMCEDSGIEIVIVPGVTAACSGASLLGAPLGHDFAVISLSDLLTPWDVVSKRLISAAQADFAICLYNPGSKSRPGHLKMACQTLLELLPKDRLCGIASSIGRDGEMSKVLTLFELSNETVGMDETAFIGSSRTMAINGRLVTPRGYA
jgi:cobalt-precorrin 5A hydrolase/precorrin-3B C17-methyltransferase